MNFRLLLQPVMATIFALREGVDDARAGRPPYFWSLFRGVPGRGALIRSGWKSIGKVFVLAIVLDVMPLASQPGPDGLRVNGLGDVLATAFLSPATPGRITWGVGPAVLLPAATNNVLGTEKFAVGPSVVALAQPGQWTVGVLFNHRWSTSGANDRPDVNQTFLQPSANDNLGGGLSVGASMEASGNWEVDETWTAPLLSNVSKVALLGKRPVNFVAAAGPMVASPESGASWRFRLAVLFLFLR